MRRSLAIQPRRSRRGFSLLELIVALAILLLLAAILTPISLRFRASAQSTTCLGNLRQIGVGLQLYLNEHNGVFPDLAAGPTAEDPEGRPSLDVFLLEYVGNDPGVFICPADTSGHSSHHSSYHWNSLLNNQHVQSVKLLGVDFAPTQIPLAFDAGAFHRRADNAVNFLFLDGSVDQATRFRVGP